MVVYAFDAHVHTPLSRDAWQSPELVFRTAARAEVQAVAITNHNTIAGVLRAERARTDEGCIVIPGEEVSTEFGDLTGLFLNKKIRTSTFADVLDEIHDQVGLSVLPHPLRRKQMPPDNLLNKIDLF